MVQPTVIKEHFSSVAEDLLSKGIERHLLVLV